MIIITGHYGSGKTEIALHEALRLKAIEGAVILVDLDVVNPFFRSSEQRAMLEASGIELVAPNFVHTNSDVPSISKGVQQAILNTKIPVVIDVGGDDTGASVLGSLRSLIEKRDYDMWFVYNTKRPMTHDLIQLQGMLRRIEDRSGLSVQHLVANSNLADHTEVSDVLEGLVMGLELSQVTKRKLKQGMVYHPIYKTFVEQFGHRFNGVPLVPLERRLIGWQGR